MLSENISVEEKITPALLTDAGVSILRILLYFDIFNHPLQENEIAAYSEFGPEGSEIVSETLAGLCESGLIRKTGSYYHIFIKDTAIKRRKDGEVQAEKALARARWYSGLIARFPYVRGVLLSGSISKNYMDKDADIDYFVITAPERMWICRTFLILFKKIFLFNSKKYFCLNYFITEESLTIPNQNLFTATELAFLIPTYNEALYHRLMNENTWYRSYYPKISLRNSKYIVPAKRSAFKNILEKILSGRAGENLDNFFFRLTLKYWKKKFSHFDPDTFDHRLRSRKNESKHHPLGYQEKILSMYESRIKDFEKKYSVILNS